MLSKKHYVSIARIIQENTIGIKKPRLHKASFVKALASYFARDNPRFNDVKFRDACGL